ncbi:helix-turn-helix domain-containing protein [Anaerotignum sp. MB30-C6]|uniref:helix-turn-helix domain-containing protein n=1 Tax=Anaerotignum sp. MB30-C6 TaxID=3070814 RepID=UPI0027DDE502|nr:helix-turn-helix domain-containing protein [Anaerotignum sp. MB30-C6]WMI80006.1 helix-turn-helix domain-containing protein [Anaerotignum sp. MB30-C6]
MREMLDASSQRIIKILEILLEHEKWITFAELSFFVEASERTIANDIAVLKDVWKDNLNIEVSKKNGVKLRNQNIASIGVVFTDIFNSSVALRWIKELLFYPDNPIEFYESKLFVSRSTLIRLIPKINRYLSLKGMEIQYKNNRYEFLGEDEQYLRDFSASFLLELYGLDLGNYDFNLDLEILRGLILAMLEKHINPAELDWISKDDISIVYKMMFYIVSMVREQQGYSVSSTHPVENEISEQYIGYIVKHFPNTNVNNLRPIHEYFYKEHNGWTSSEERELVSKEITEYLNRFFSTVSVSPDENTLCTMHYILKSFYFKVKLRPFKTSELFNRIHYFALSLKQTNPLLYQAAEENLKITSQNIKADISPAVSDVLFWTCLACPEAALTTSPRRALLIDDFGRLHTQFLAKTLSNFFFSKVLNFCVDTAPFPEVLMSKIPDHYDIIITTIPNLPFKHKNMVLINDFPTSDDFCKIHRAI